MTIIIGRPNQIPNRISKDSKFNSRSSNFKLSAIFHHTISSAGLHTSNKHLSDMDYWHYNKSYLFITFFIYTVFAGAVFHHKFKLSLNFRSEISRMEISSLAHIINVPATPMPLFAQWFDEAKGFSDPKTFLNNMCLASRGE